MKVQKKSDADANQTVEAQSLDSKVLSLESDQVSYVYTPDNQLQFLFPKSWPKQVRIEFGDGPAKREYSVDLEHQFIPVVVQQATAARFYSGQQLLDEVIVLPPIDMNVENRTSLKQKLNLTAKNKSLYFRKLHLAKETELMLEDFSGTIYVENLESDNGTISMFSEDSVSVNHLLARSGGKVYVNVKDGQGAINFRSKGEDGAHGENGKAPDDFIKGANGADGKIAEFRIEDGAGDSYESTGQDKFYFYYCSKPPVYGNSGKPGKKGYAGEGGKDGGNSGSFIVNNSSANLKISLEILETHGGRGGVGGDGGQGGRAGLTGDGAIGDVRGYLSTLREACDRVHKNVTCWDSKAHKIHIVKQFCNGYEGVAPSNGAQGERGIDGSPGKAGLRQPSCLYQNSQLVQCYN